MKSPFRELLGVNVQLNIIEDPILRSAETEIDIYIDSWVEYRTIDGDLLWKQSLFYWNDYYSWYKL